MAYSVGMRDREQIGTPRWLLWLALRVFWGAISAIVFRPQVTGRETLPTDGPYLLLANHTSTFDTLWVSAPLGRPAHFMTSAALFRNPIAGWVLPLVGAFPKEVGKKDRTSAATLQALYEGGAIIQIMPEGARTWDGRLQPVGTGLGRLVKRLNARVVVCRVDTGHWCWPRWATWPRWVPLHLHFHPPQTWDSGASDAHIRDAIVAQMTPVAPHHLGRSLCFRPAEGLPTFLYACPECGSRPTRAERDTLCCDGCQRRWLVGADMTLRPTDAPQTTLPLAHAYDAMRQHFGAPMVDTRTGDRERGIALRAPCTVLHLRRGQPDTVLADGPLTLSESGLRADDWHLPFSDIRSIHMDAGNVLNLRIAEGLVRVAPEDGQTYLWENAIRSWWEGTESGD